MSEPKNPIDFLRFYLFWKWEYQRRNREYIDDYKKLMNLASDVAKETGQDVQKAIIGVDLSPNIVQKWGDKIKKAMPSTIDWSGKLEDLPGLGWELYLNHICGIDSAELVQKLSDFEKKHQRDPTPYDSGLTANDIIEKITKEGGPEDPMDSTGSFDIWRAGLFHLYVSTLPEQERQKVFSTKQTPEQKQELDTLKIRLSRPEERKRSVLLLPFLDKTVTLYEKYGFSFFEYPPKDVEDLLDRWVPLIKDDFKKKRAVFRIDHTPRAVGLWLWEEAQGRSGRQRPGIVTLFKEKMGQEKLDKLGYTYSDARMFYRLLDGTQCCIDNADVLPVS